MSKQMTFYKKVDIASAQAGEDVYRRVSISIEDFNAACDHYGFVRERTCRDVSENPLRFECSECGGVSLEIAPRFCPLCGRKVAQ